MWFPPILIVLLLCVSCCRQLFGTRGLFDFEFRLTSRSAEPTENSGEPVRRDDHDDEQHDADDRVESVFSENATFENTAEASKAWDIAQVDVRGEENELSLIHI